MSDSTIKDLISRSNRILGKRDSLLSLWQNISDHFYPMRADFTIRRDLGDELNDQLYTSFPSMVRRDLADSFSSMLRPTAKAWYHIATDDDPEELPHDAKAWLEEKAAIMRKIIYKKDTQFTRATKEGDNDFAAFGNAVIQVRPNIRFDGIFYRSFHLRDVGWIENAEGKIIEVHRKQKMAATDMIRFFGRDKVDHKVRDMVDDSRKDSYHEFELRHLMLPSDDYHDQKYARFPHVSMWVDVDNMTMLEEIGSKQFQYVIPRWTTASGSQYGYSPAAITALPDARLIQQMTRIILDAGEKTSNPPMIAVEEMISSSIDTFAGGVTWVDAEYDERLGEVLRPISQNYSGLPLGMDMQQQVQEMIKEAFYISKLSLPPQDGKMTAFEVGQRVQEYIRKALPLFEPVESNYNGALCEETFSLLMDMGAFGSPFEIPQSLRSKEIAFKFESPLHDSIEKIDATKFSQAGELLAQAGQLDQSIFSMFDFKEGMRDALKGLQVPTKWIRSPEDVEAIMQAQRQQQEQEQKVEGLKQMAESLGKAAPGLKVMKEEGVSLGGLGG